MHGLQLENLVTEFDGGGEIGPINLSLERGQMMALIGPSGSGKTTTLRMIAGLAPIYSGTMSFDGRDIAALSVRKRRVGMVFQNFGLFPHLNVSKNITFGLRMKGKDLTVQNERLSWIMEKTRLQGLEKRFASELSGGQKQRVALARTLVMDPDILLLDEPLSNLDANLREEMADFIRNLQRELGITTLFVTHDQDEALMLADQVAVMSDGQVLQQGTSEEVYERPNSLTVAEFMGAGNILPGRFTENNFFECGLGALVCDASHTKTKKAVMIRPDHMQLQSEDSAHNGYSNRMQGIISTVQYHGAFSSYTVDVGGVRLRIRMSSRDKFAEGERVKVSFQSKHVWPIAEHMTTNNRVFS
jgi:ABC-type Fe3+/spermidine/putrescine transport system ATPase subunit